MELLHPEYVICLGRFVSEQVASLYEVEIPPNKPFNEVIDEELHQGVIKPFLLGEKRPMAMFAMAHLGSQGQANRNKYLKKRGQTYEEDWRILGRYVTDNIKY